MNSALVRTAVIVGAAVLAGCPAGPSDQGKPAAGPAQVTASKPAKRDITRRITLPVEFWAWQRVLIVAKVTGYVGEVRVDRGSVVKGGDLLATVEVPELKDERDRVAKEIKTYEAEIASATAQHDLQALIVKRMEGLVADKAVTVQDVDEAKAKELVLSAAIDQAQSKLDAAREHLKSANTWLAYSQITAPFLGLVTDRWVHPGSFVSAAEKTQLFNFTDNSTIRAVVDVPEADCTRLKVGETAVKILLSELGSFDGVVSRSSAALEPRTRTRRIEVDLKNPDGLLLPGMYGQATFALEVHKDATAVPRSAIATTSQGPTVYVVSAGKAHRVPVRLGLDEGELVEITSGVSPDDVVASVALGLSDGASVTVVEPKPSPDARNKAN